MHSKPLAAIHKYIALSIGIFIALQGLTGASLLFRQDIEDLIHPERLVRPVEGQRVAWEAVFKSALARVPDGTRFTIRTHGNGERAFEVFVEHPEAPRRLYINPYTGAVITDTYEPGTPMALLYRLHSSLLNGDTGEYFVAAIGVVLATLSITGLILWWPRKLRDAVRVRWGGNALAVNFDLHRMMGAIFALLLLINALTGLVLLFSEQSQKLVNHVFAKHVFRASGVPEASKKLGTYRSLDEIVAAADRSFSEGSIARIRVPMPSGTVVVQRRVPESERHINGMNRVFVDPHTATVLDTLIAADNPPGIRLFGWLYPLHAGEYFAGQKPLWSMVGIAPSFMLVTGLAIWWTRRRSRSKRGYMQKQGPAK